MRAWLARLFQIYVVELRSAADRASDRARAASPDPDRKMLVVLATALTSLLFLAYFGNLQRLEHWALVLEFLGGDEWAMRFERALTVGEDRRIVQKVFWVTARIIAYILLPMAAILVFFPGRRRRALIDTLGIGVQGLIRHVPVYGFFLAVIAPFVIAASFLDGFQAKYPFYRLAADEALWPWFFAWEVLYALQFVGLEVFYRGFLLHGLKERLGYASIFVTLLPYTMIHFQKPLPEALGSVVAGFALGTMSLKSGSVWWGAALHVIVAWAMDFLSLAHQRFG